MNKQMFGHRKGGNQRQVRLMKLAALGALVAAGLGFPQSGMAETETVSCPGESIQARLDSGPPIYKSRTIVVSGTCDENVQMTRDDVTLVGGTVHGTITVSGARRVGFRNITVTGPGDGIVGTAAASLVISASDIRGNAENGVLLTGGAHGVITGSSVSDNALAGVKADGGAQVEVYASTISGNLGTGNGAVEATNHSLARIENSLIESNAGEGIGVYNHSTVHLVGNTISNNGTLDLVDPVNPSEYFNFAHAGVGVYNGSLARFSGGNVVSGSTYFAVAAWGGSVLRQGSFQPKRIVNHGGAVGPAPETDTFIQRSSTGGINPDGNFDQPGIHFGAVEVGRMSTVDIRNAVIDGHLSRYQSAYMDVRFGTITNGSVFCTPFGSQFGPMIRGNVDYNGGTFDPFLDCL